MFFELRVAKAWRLSPSQWRRQPVDDRALMMAYEMFQSTRDAYREEWREARQKQKDKPGSTSRNPYHDLLATMGLPRPGG